MMLINTVYHHLRPKVLLSLPMRMRMNITYMIQYLHDIPSQCNVEAIMTIQVSANTAKYLVTIRQ